MPRKTYLSARTPAQLRRERIEDQISNIRMLDNQGLEQPVFDPINMISGLGGIGATAGVPAMLRALPGFVAAEVPMNLAYERLSRDFPGSWAVPLAGSMAAGMLSGAALEKVAPVARAAMQDGGDMLAPKADYLAK